MSYGIAPRTPGEPLSKWLWVSRQIKHHACGSYPSNASMPDPFYGSGSGRGPLTSFEIQEPAWAGKIADFNCVMANPSSPNLGCNDFSHDYVETDSDFWVSCGGTTSALQPNGTNPSATYGEWAGLGGLASNLQQAGVSMDYYPAAGNSSVTTVWPFYEEVPPQTSEQVIFSLPTINCGSHIYVKIWGGNCKEIIDLDQNYSWAQCDGPSAGWNSAELITENAAAGANEGVPSGIATTFHGAGVTDNDETPSYVGYGTVQHDYANAYLGGVKALNPGPIQNDPGDVPYDKYTVSEVSVCGGLGSACK